MLRLRAMTCSRTLISVYRVIPISAHAAFDKAGEYFKIKVRHIPVDPISRKVNLKRVSRAINSNTIMVNSVLHDLSSSADAPPSSACGKRAQLSGRHC